MNSTDQTVKHYTPVARSSTNQGKAARQNKKKEIGGPRGPEPTRFGDWEKKGRCVDF